MLRYEYRDNKYMLVDDDGEVLNTLDQVYLLFDDNVLLKHGSEDRVRPEYEALRKTFVHFGVEHRLHIITGDIPVEEINKMIEITGYLPKEVRV